MSQFLMPSLGADMEAGILVEWLKAPGDIVARGDILAVVETQKGAIEIEVFEDGVLGNILAQVGDEVPVGTPLADILTEGTDPGDLPDIPPKKAEVAQVHTPPVPPEKPTIIAPAPLPETDGQRLRVTPAARRFAQQHQINLSDISVPPGKEISLVDVERLVKDTETETQTSQSAMREAIAAAMSRSKQEIPHYYLSHIVDITAAETFVTSVNADRAPSNRLILGAVFAKAVARALKKYPEFNGHFTDNGFSPSQAAHIGMAINLRGGGLVAPALHDVQTKSLDDLMNALRDLVSRVRAGRFRARELSDPTITISSLGDRGVEQLYGVIYPPQVAILGFGTPLDRPWAHDGKIALRRMVTLTLAADHRVSDGHRGALFLKAIEKLLQKPETL